MAKRYSFPIPLGWFCESMSGDLKASEVKPLHYLGRELVMFRTEAGEPKMLYAKNMPPKVSGGKGAVGAYQTIERNHMIWAWYHLNRVALIYDIDALPDFSPGDWEVGECRSWTINTMLQEIQENAADPEHFIYVYGAQQPVGEVISAGHKRTARYDLQAPAILPDGSLDLSGKMTRGHLESIVTCAGQGVQRARRGLI